MGPWGKQPHLGNSALASCQLQAPTMLPRLSRDVTCQAMGIL